MRRRRNGGRIAALALALGATTAVAQDVTDFRLQPRDTATSRPQGPVDSDAPVVRPVARPTPSEAAPSPQPAPSATTAPPSPSATAAPAAVPARQAPTQTARPDSRTNPQSNATASPAPAAGTPTEASAEAAPTTSTQAESPVVIETFGPSPSSTRSLPFDPWWLALPAGILLLLGALLKMRRKPEADWDDEAEPDDLPVADEDPELPAEVAPVAALSATKIAPPTAPVRDAAPEPLTPAVPIAPVNDTNGALTISLEVGRMNATLVNAALTWKLTILNSGDKPLCPVIVAGDMIAAHASLPVEQQLATDGQPLELIREIAAINPGDESEVTGEFRVPLASIKPITAGSALLYIPLVRFRVEAEGASTLATFAIGETPPVAAAALLPFRLDLGPRVWSRISHRQVDREPLSA
ncbi:MAG: hypothetical protein ACKOPO_03795 [Novosphingobium sp.]